MSDEEKGNQQEISDPEDVIRIEVEARTILENPIKVYTGMKTQIIIKTSDFSISE